MNNARRLPGFTIVELLVVIAIFALLLALLMPAVQVARESARRSTCSGNVRQIASALQTYEHSQGSLPPGIKARLRWSDWVRDPTRDDLGYEWTYFLHYLLPHAEQLQLFEVLRGPEFDIHNP
jgi:prepilin-type N-terminal cleavage/methylation domain-containing protein